MEREMERWREREREKDEERQRVGERLREKERERESRFFHSVPPYQNLAHLDFVKTNILSKYKVDIS